MPLTVSTHYAIPSLIGRGLTESTARAKLLEAKMLGFATAQAGDKTVPITYSHGKYTIGRPK